MLCDTKKFLLKDCIYSFLNAFSQVSSLVEKKIDSSKNYHTDEHILCAKIWQLEVFIKKASNKTFFKRKNNKRAAPRSAPLKSDRK